MTTTAETAKIATAEQALTLATGRGVPMRGATLEGVDLVAYAGSLREQRGPCWQVGWCDCGPCTDQARGASCTRRVLVTLDGTLMQHVRAFSVSELHPDQVPPALRPCAGCQAEPGQPCHPFCLSGEAC